VPQLSHWFFLLLSHSTDPHILPNSQTGITQDKSHPHPPTLFNLIPCIDPLIYLIYLCSNSTEKLSRAYFVSSPLILINHSYLPWALFLKPIETFLTIPTILSH
jgi:hypothetical protein